jgi:protease IV
VLPGRSTLSHPVYTREVADRSKEDHVALRRGVGIVIFLVAFACLVSLGGILAVWLMLGREPSVPQRATLVMRLDTDFAEGGSDEGFSQFLPGTRTPTVRAIVENLRKAKADSRIAAVLIKPTNLQSPYLAKIQEVRDAVADFRRSGKQAIAYLEDGGQAEYYLATACDRIYLAPISPLSLTGVASYALFLRGTLDKIDAYPDMLHIGEYKTAVNQLTQKTFTPAHREMEESLNRESYDQLVRAVADGRRKTEDEVRLAMDAGPLLPEDALRAGLVDDLVYEDQIGERAKIPLQKERRLDLDDYARVDARSLGINRGPRIAVIYAAGTIVSGRSGYDPLNGPVLGSDTLVESIRRVRESPDIKAVVLRIDSPGGSAVASDLIWRELVLLRDSKPSKPLVVSMSDLAASGGYYMAMAAPHIVAEPATLTGSIGIFGGKIVTGGTYAKLGASIEAVSQGKHAQMNSPARPYTAEERAKVGEHLQAFYDQFVEKAAASRHMTPEQVDAIAQGRVWTGRQAKQVGLVDELGGLERAVAVAKMKAKIPAGSEVELVTYPPRRSFYDVLLSQLGGSEGAWGVASLLSLDQRRAVGIVSAPLRLFRAGEPLALMPEGYLR